MPPRRDISPELKTAIVATGIRHELNENYSLAMLKGALQVRHDQTGEGTAKLNHTKVVEYRNKFQAGSMCPPIGVTRDGYLVWGNHRVGGAEAAELLDLPAIVLNVDGAEPDLHTTLMLKGLSAEENSTHGLGLTPKDKEMHVRDEIKSGSSNKAIQRKYGWSAAQVSSLRRQMEAEERLNDLGVWTTVADRDRALLRAFSGEAARHLTNEPFKALVHLAADAKLAAKDVNVLAEAARGTGTELGAIEAIAAKRVELDQRIASVASSGEPEKPTPVTRLRKAVNEAAGLCDKAPASAYRDYTVDSATTKEQIAKAIECLQAILAVQD